MSKANHLVGTSVRREFIASVPVRHALNSGMFPQQASRRGNASGAVPCARRVRAVRR